MPQRVETDFNFRVQIDGFEDAAFAEARGLGSTIEVVEYREGSDPSLGVRLLPGRVRFDRIVLRRGLASSFELWDWHQAIAQGATDPRSGVIAALTRDGQPVVTWRFRNGWIARYEGPAFTAKGNDVAIETIELVHEGLVRESP